MTYGNEITKSELYVPKIRDRTGFYVGRNGCTRIKLQKDFIPTIEAGRKPVITQRMVLRQPIYDYMNENYTKLERETICSIPPDQLERLSFNALLSMRKKLTKKTEEELVYSQYILEILARKFLATNPITEELELKTNFIRSEDVYREIFHCKSPHYRLAPNKIKRVIKSEERHTLYYLNSVMKFIAKSANINRKVRKKPSDYNFMKTKEVEEMTGRTRESISRAAVAGRLNFYKISDKLSLYEKEDIETWMNATKNSD